VAYAQPAGKARLAVADWARGRGIELGDVFSAPEPEAVA
jgi:hypothetical protein